MFVVAVVTESSVLQSCVFSCLMTHPASFFLVHLLQVKCIALRSANRNKVDPSIRPGLHWLLDQIGQQYEALCERVNADVTRQRAAEAQKRKERAERVCKIREERERLASQSLMEKPIEKPIH